MNERGVNLSVAEMSSEVADERIYPDAFDGFGVAMQSIELAIDQVVASGSDFGHEDRTQGICSIDTFLVETLVAIIRNVFELDGLDGEAFSMSLDEGQKTRDIEDEDSVWIELIAGLRSAGLKFLIALEFSPYGRNLGFQCGPLHCFADFSMALNKSSRRATLATRGILHYLAVTRAARSD